MPSVVGLLEQRELTARRRMDELREEADRIQAELVVVEREWNEWVIARSRVGEVLAPGDDDACEERSDRGDLPAAPGTSGAAKPKSVVPMWRAGLVWSALSADYQRILQVLADRSRLGQGPLTCQEMAACFGRPCWTVLPPSPSIRRRSWSSGSKRADVSGVSRRIRTWKSITSASWPISNGPGTHHRNGYGS
jgi:hypothetical protein